MRIGICFRILLIEPQLLIYIVGLALFEVFGYEMAILRSSLFFFCLEHCMDIGQNVASMMMYC